MFGLMLAALALVAAGCGSDSDGDGGDGQAAETVTVTETEVETVEEPATEEEPADEEPAPADDSSGSGTIEVPDVVGEDHQLAQDTMQAAGLYNLSEEDATGEGRMLLYDRNWTVVSQDPPAGTRVSEDQTITLSSKKDGE